MQYQLSTRNSHRLLNGTEQGPTKLYEEFCSVIAEAADNTGMALTPKTDGEYLVITMRTTKNGKEGSLGMTLNAGSSNHK